MDPAERFERFREALINLCEDYEVTLDWDYDMLSVWDAKPGEAREDLSHLQNQTKETK